VTALVLASRSEARLRLLRAAGVAVEAIPALVDEVAVREGLQAEGVAVEDAAVALAELKAAFVAGRAAQAAIVLGADQLLELDGAWLEKPASEAAAREQLRALRGRSHRLVSAAVAFRDGVRVWHHVESARLQVRAFTDGFLDHYLAEAGGAVLGCVGAYQLEGLGAQLMARVEGDHFTVQGLPLLPVLAFLRDQGVLRP
jgi:septum formation protein